ncbi:MAG: hypothetical protein LUG61_10555 [Lachnospiraceae bacterium]|nr:hypothetical protein [Lachnospiraceae bacterium]
MKKWIRGLAFVVILALLIGRTYRILSWKDTYGEYLSCIQQLYHTCDDLMDVVSVGSSHVFCGINPAVLWDEYGISGFVLGSSAQPRAVSYHYLVEALKTQSPKVVCVDLYGLTLEVEDLDIAYIYRGTVAMRQSLNSIQLVRETVSEEDQMENILRWPVIHTRYGELQKEDFVEDEVNEYGLGYYITWYRTSSEKLVEAMRSDTTQAYLSESQMGWLESLVDLSDQENFELIFFICPYDMTEHTDAWEMYNTAKAFAAENDISVLDFNVLGEEIGIDYEQDFSDDTHLNAWGAEKVTSYFGAFLEETAELTDHRGDDNYTRREWNLSQYLSEKESWLEME